jgi:hypothetical protein
LGVIAGQLPEVAFSVLLLVELLHPKNNNAVAMVMSFFTLICFYIIEL